MARPNKYVVDFPTLFVAADWVQAHCIVPDGFLKGEHFELVDWQLWGMLNYYRLKPEAQLGQKAQAFHWRRSQIVLPQKAGKAPYTAAHVCVEGVGPALFGGWAEGGEVWDCRDHGCPCGWVYEYQPGEALAQQWPTPLIQITATSEDQTDNIYDALRPMIDDGPLHEVIPKTGEEFIRLPGGRIDVVTSNATSRLGQRCTFVPQDETGLWVKQNAMIRVAETQRRGLAGMGGRAEETTNAWNPAEDSVAQRTAEAKVGDIFRIHPQAPSSLSYRNKRERRKIHRVVYEGCKWVDLDDIEAEAAEILERDAAQAERFFGNNPVAGAGQAFDPDVVDARVEHYQPSEGSLIVIGVDGARFADAFAAIATEVETGYQWVIGIWERPENAPDDYEHPFDEIDGAMIEADQRFEIWRVYIDPQYIDNMVDKWQGRWGKEKVSPWYTHTPRKTAFAVRHYTQALASGDVTHSGDDAFVRHLKNAVRWKTNAVDDDQRPMHTIGKDRPGSPFKMDAAVAAVISWEARGDAIAADAKPANREVAFL